MADAAGIMRKTGIHRSNAAFFKAIDALNLAVDELRAEPGFFLCPEGTCHTCNAAWPSVSDRNRSREIWPNLSAGYDPAPHSPLP